jgi:hypothetical protein
MTRHQPKAHTASFPRSVEELIRELDRRFPEPRFTPGQDHAEVMFEAGRRSVVHQLRDAYEAATRKDPHH